jgi:hypothetical protein
LESKEEGKSRLRQRDKVSYDVITVLKKSSVAGKIH